MGHPTDDATRALRAYASDLQSTAQRGGLVSLVGASKQDDASVRFSGSGAPHQMALAAAVACVVLLGGIGLANSAGSTPPTQSEPVAASMSRPASFDAVFARAGNITTVNAIRAFADLGMTRSVAALSVASDAGVDSTPGVTGAVSSLFSVVADSLTRTGTVSESDLDVALAVAVLEQAARPPGLDPNRVSPGLGGTPPGQDPAWIPPGQDPEFVPPGQDPEFVPPGQERGPETGKLDAPGQSKVPNKSKGSPTP